MCLSCSSLNLKMNIESNEVVITSRDNEATNNKATNASNKAANNSGPESLRVNSRGTLSIMIEEHTRT